MRTVRWIFSVCVAMHAPHHVPKEWADKLLLQRRQGRWAARDPVLGNRGIYHKGWTAVTRHKTPWILVGEKTPAFDDDVWELYDTSKDWSQAKEMPEKLHELQRLSLIEATRYNVLPMDDDPGRRLNADTAGRPVLIKGKTQILFGGMGHLSENTVLNLKNKSHAVTAEIEVPQSGAAEAGCSVSPAVMRRVTRQHL